MLKLKQAALRALYDSHTWIPTAGAALFSIDDFDEKTSNWASDNTPVFGSQQGALDASDDLRTATIAASYLAVLSTPSGMTANKVVPAKLKGLTVRALAMSATTNLTGILKRSTQRLRPDDPPTAVKDSFPSAHASSAFANAAFARANLPYLDFNNRTTRIANWGLTTMAAGTAWARVEGNVHYPSDVLFGAALGNFISVFFNNAFMGINNDAPWHLKTEHSLDALSLKFNINF